ncbi:hypothetical protein [Chromobacterium vaccinii]|uniref:hypothetical protein n=1 Tax=Chromobacterium vaccinii TaxID=1108595 RepID=UPI0011AB872A|nr:hypothetical protein [Chromobacterium vaccinii]
MSATLPMRQNGRREEKHLQLPRQCTGLPAAVTAAVFSKTLQKNQIFSGTLRQFRFVASAQK